MPTTPPQLRLVGHDHFVTSLAFSADGSTLVSGSYDKTAIVWDVKTGRMRRILSLRNGINDLALTPDGKTVITGDGQFWDTATGQSVRKWRRFGHPFACSPDDKTLASTLYEEENVYSILLTDIYTGRPRKQVSCEGHLPYGVTFSADGELVAVICANSLQTENDDWIIFLFSAHTGERIRTFSTPHEYLFGVNLKPYLRLVTVSASGNEWTNAETGKALPPKLVWEAADVSYAGGPMSMALSQDSHLLTVGTSEGFLTVWNGNPTRCFWKVKAHEGWIRSLVFTNDATLLASAGDDHAIRLWEVATGQLVCTLGGHRPEVDAVAFAADGHSFTAMGNNGSARLWHIGNQTLQRQEGKNFGVLAWRAPHTPITARNLWKTDVANLPSLEDLFGKKENLSICPGDGAVMALSPDGTLAAIQSTANVTLWHLPTRRKQCALIHPIPFWAATAFSPDNRFVAVASSEEFVWLFEVSTGKLRHKLRSSAEVRLSQARHLVFSADSATLVVGDRDDYVSLWKVSSGMGRQVAQAHEGIMGLALSPDGKTLAVSTAYATVAWLWRLQRGGRQLRLDGHTDNVRSADYAPDGNWLLTSARDGTVRLREASTGATLATFVGLPSEEWLIYTPEGYYTGSAGAEASLCWQAGAELLSANTFANVYNNAAEVQRLITRGFIYRPVSSSAPSTN